MNSLRKRYCTVKELSAYTGFPAGTLYEWASLGMISSIKIRRRVFFDLNEIDRFFYLHNKAISAGEIIAKVDSVG